MTDDELRAAEFLRSIRYDHRGDGGYVNADEMDVPYFNVSEARETLADAWLAEHLADDGEPADFEWLAAQGKLCEDQGYWDVPPSGDVWWEVGPISFTCEVCQSDPGEPVEAVATDWQVGGQMLPKLLVPKTRGQFRRLLELAGYKPEGK